MVLLVETEVIVRMWPIVLQFTGCIPKFSNPGEAPGDRGRTLEVWGGRTAQGISVLHWAWKEHTTTSQCSPGISFLAVLSDFQQPTAEDLSHLEGFPAAQSWCQAWCVLAQDLHVIFSSMSGSSSATGGPFPRRMGLAFSPCSLYNTSAKAMPEHARQGCKRDSAKSAVWGNREKESQKPACQGEFRGAVVPFFSDCAQ